MTRWFWAIDGAAVVAFVILGRDSHGREIEWLSTLEVAAPFLTALAGGIAVTRRRLSPTAPTTGLVLGVITVVGGLVLRRLVFGSGTAIAFVIVTTAWVLGTMVGWRLLRLLGTRRATRRAVRVR